MQQLQPASLQKIDGPIQWEKLLQLPEKILQFGTGVLLRGLPDYFVDKANKAGIFNGRIVVIKSTKRNTTDAFGNQGGLYTHLIRGIETGQKVESTHINAAISRVINANFEWDSILECARNRSIDIIISNTTEVGLVLDKEDSIGANPPASFPGKLVAILYERYKSSNGAQDAGFVIIPTELIPDNGKVLQQICNQLAESNQLEAGFIEWMNTCNQFCSSLVDRIVPGMPAAEDKAAAEASLQFTDELMIMSEPYRLWAIEANNPVVKQKLSFAAADKGVVIAPDINKFRELKLRLLNGTHTFSCGLAVLAGFDIVKSAMQQKEMQQFIHQLMINEMAPCITGAEISHEESTAFAYQVLDRFANPFINHKWISITAQYTSKMHMRNVPMIKKYVQKNGKPPALMALGFAGYLHVMTNAAQSIDDPVKSWYADNFDANAPETSVIKVLQHAEFWGQDLTAIEGWAEAVLNAYTAIAKEGAASCIQAAAANC